MPNEKGLPPNFKTVEYEGVRIDVDENTGGIWLDEGELKKIIDLRQKKFDPQEQKAVANAQPIRGVPEHEIAHERISPVSGKVMEPINFGGDTGVIIDRCPDSGGIWLDAGELEKIQMLVEGWEDQLPEDLKEYSPKLHDVAAEVDANDDVAPSRLPLIGGAINSLVNGVLDMSGLRGRGSSAF